MKVHGALLALLLLCVREAGAQGDGGLVNARQSGADPAATPSMADMWREVTGLRDKVHSLATMLVQVRERLAVGDKQVQELKRLDAEMAAKLTAGESQVEVLQTRLSSSENNVQALKKESEAHVVQLSTIENTVEELKKQNAAHVEEVEELKRQNAAHLAQLSTVETRLTASETQVQELKRQDADKPKVAFSVGLGGTVGPVSSHSTTLVYNKVFSNIGNAYNTSSGIFTAPARGVYHFTFIAAQYGSSNEDLRIQMFKNEDQLFYLYGKNNHANIDYVSNGLIVEMEQGDTVCMRLPSGYKLYDDSNNNNMWSGFLVYSM